MNDTLVQDSLKLAENAISKTSDNISFSSFWMWVAIGEFAILVGIVIISFLTRKSNFKQGFKEKSLNQEVDFENIINSSFKSNELYDMLKVKCHPDRFPNDKKLNAEANDLFQKISKNKNNYKKLEQLKDEAQRKLNIKL